MIGRRHVARICASAVLLFLAAGAPAQSFIIGIPPAGLRAYTEVDGAKKPAGDLKSADVTLPLQLIEEDGDFGRVNTSKGALWVDLRRAQVKRDVAADCTAASAKGLGQSRVQVATAGTRGAGGACAR